MSGHDITKMLHYGRLPWYFPAMFRQWMLAKEPAVEALTRSAPPAGVNSEAIPDNTGMIRKAAESTVQQPMKCPRAHCNLCRHVKSVSLLQ